MSEVRGDSCCAARRRGRHHRSRSGQARGQVARRLLCTARAAAGSVSGAPMARDPGPPLAPVEGGHRGVEAEMAVGERHVVCSPHRDPLDEPSQVVAEVPRGPCQERRGRGGARDLIAGQQSRQHAERIALLRDHAAGLLHLDPSPLTAEGEERVTRREGPAAADHVLAGALQEDRSRAGRRGA